MALFTCRRRSGRWENIPPSETLSSRKKQRKLRVCLPYPMPFTLMMMIFSNAFRKNRVWISGGVLITRGTINHIHSLTNNIAILGHNGCRSLNGDSFLRLWIVRVFAIRRLCVTSIYRYNRLTHRVDETIVQRLNIMDVVDSNILFTFGVREAVCGDYGPRNQSYTLGGYC